MQKLLNSGNEFIKRSTWKDLALLKFCLCAMGVMWGMALPKKAHKPAAWIAVCVFIATYIPLMLKWFKTIRPDESSYR